MGEGRKIGGFIIRSAVAPAEEHDALPLEGESAHGAGMTLAFGDLLLEEELGPRTVEGRLPGILEEALMDEVRATVAPMNPMLVLTALLRDWGDAAVLLDGLGVGITGALAPESAGEPGGEGRPGAGEALPEGRIAMAGEELLDLPVVLFDGQAKLE